MKDEESSSTSLLVHLAKAVVSMTPVPPSVLSMTSEVLLLASPPPAAAPTLSQSPSAIVSPPCEPGVQRVPIKKRKVMKRFEGVAKRTKSIMIPVIYLDIYMKLKEMEEQGEQEGDIQKLREITCIKKGLMWIGEEDEEENSIELWERRMTLVHEALSLE